MKTSILSVVLDIGAVAFRRLPPCLLAVSAFLMTTAQAQEKPGESAHAAGWVVIPVEEYRVLRAKAYPVEHDPEPPPLDATLTRVDYDLHVTGELAAGRANLTVDVLKDGWVRVPVPAGLLVREARLDGKLVSLVPAPQGKGAGHLSALLSHPGRWVLALDVDVPVTASTSDESISLPSTESGVTRASVELPRQGVDLRVDGGILSEKSETSGETKWLVYGRGNEALTLSWRKKTEDHHIELPLRMRGLLTQLTSLGEDSTAIYAEASLEIVQGAAREVRIQLPEKLTINQVSGAMIADWEMKNGELAITFLEPVEHSARFVINGEARLPRDGIIDIPLLRLLHTERDSGGVAVEILGAGEIKDQKAQGLEDADASDLGEMIASRQSPALAAFRARAGEAGTTRTLSVNVARYDQQAVLMANIEEARYDILMSADGKELVQARYAVRNNQRNFVKIALPPGASVWSASLGGRPAASRSIARWKSVVASRKIARGRGRSGFRGRTDVRHQGTRVAGQRQADRHFTCTGSADFSDGSAVLLPAHVPSCSRTWNFSHAGVSRSDFGRTLERRERDRGRVFCGGFAWGLGGDECTEACCTTARSRSPRTIRKAPEQRRQRKERCHAGVARQFQVEVDGRPSDGHRASQHRFPGVWSIDLPGLRTYQRESVPRCRIQLPA